MPCLTGICSGESDSDISAHQWCSGVFLVVFFFIIFFFLEQPRELNIAKLLRICSALRFYSILQVLHTDKRIEKSEILRGISCLKSVAFSFQAPVL